MRKVECERCLDENGYIVIVDNLEVWQRCFCYEGKRIKRMMKSSQITDEFRKKTFDNFDITNKPPELNTIKNSAISYYLDFQQIRKDRHNSFALVGQVGSGKTHLLCAISNALLADGVQVLYFPFVEGMNNLKANFEELEEKTDRIKKAEVLFIDDLFKGRETPTGWQIETMFSIVNYRYLNHLPILVTSEKDFNTLLEIDEALGSRIYEMSKNNRFVLKGKNMNYRLT
jgi:DNA replication protein DnaC